MIKFENTQVTGWEHAIRGMRNPKNSWDKSDSFHYAGKGPSLEEAGLINPITGWHTGFEIGDNDLKLMTTLRNAGTDHRKFMRMIVVYADITAPLYWWKEFDTYKVGTVANSCSTMHKIAAKEFTLEDFSCEHLMSTENSNYWEEDDDNSCFIEVGHPKSMVLTPLDILENTIIPILNVARIKFLETKDKKYWWQLIQLLPSSYNQKRTVMLNYEVLANIYKSRKYHKLDEWAEHEARDIDSTSQAMYAKDTYIGFCDWIENLPYSELITGGNEPYILGVDLSNGPDFSTNQ